VSLVVEPAEHRAHELLDRELGLDDRRDHDAGFVEACEVVESRLLERVKHAV